VHKIEFLDIEENNEYEKTISKVLEKCFEVESLPKEKLLVSITLTNPENIRKLNKEYRNIDKSTDVLSFPMFEKDEIDNMVRSGKWEFDDILGDMVISIEQVQNQAKEYGHSFERELSYMVVHSFYHLMGYDHIKEEDKELMRPKEEFVLNELGITRN
jgi:probable rRNA maturation factor